MTTATAGAAVVALLDAITSPVALDAGANLFPGPLVPPSASQAQLAVCVSTTGGPTMERLCGTSVDHRVVSVQVSIRADRSDFSRGEALANACLLAVHAPTIPTGYVEVRVREPVPNYVGMDALGRHSWTFNAYLTRVD